jgi:signal transduction histidine kinase
MANAEIRKVLIAIQDEGPGISESDQHNLFKEYSRLTAQPTGGESSTGLGLFIVKSFVQVMGGKVWCDSALGEGATFTVEFDMPA